MKKGTFAIKYFGNKYWIYQQRSAGQLPDDPLSILLTWILQQINFGNIDYWKDDEGDITSLTIGEKAAWTFETLEQAEEHARGMLLAIAFSSIHADAREAGVYPNYADTLKRVDADMNEFGLRNTEMHFAQQLVKLLKRMSDKTFKFSAPPIAGLAPEVVTGYMSEASRFWFYGLYNACAGLCRACLETSLRAKLGQAEKGSWHNATFDSGQKDGLVQLIDMAARHKLLDGPSARQAHLVRECGNDAVHGDTINANRCREALDAMRSVVEYLYTTEG